MRNRRFILFCVMVVAVSLLTSGCALNFYKQSPRSKQKISDLESKISDLEAERMAERAKFEAVKKMLQDKLRSQIAGDQISLRLGAGGLAIVMSDNILFDSGKATLKRSAYSILDKVAAVIKKEVPGKNIGVSGHTDSMPIKHSTWRSNWELSTARATNVLHYLEEEGIPSSRLSATGYGEHRPIATNATASGRAQNRRVEIVILPEFEEERDQNVSGKAQDENIK